jgi:hypothetical protein
MDEQHSRSQRKFGSAPYCTATFLNKDSLIFQMVSVDDDIVKSSTVTTKAGEPAKSKAKVAHCLGMKGIVDYFQRRSQLRHFCIDQSSDGASDAETYFRPAWPDFFCSYDVWHKIKEFDGLWKAFCSERERPRGSYDCFPFYTIIFSHSIGPYRRKELQYLYSSGLLPVHVFKKHFEYCCGTCRGDTIEERVNDWLRIWLNASTWVEQKWNEGWLERYISDMDSMFFLFFFGIAIYYVVFYDADAEFEVRDNAQHRIRQQVLQFLTPLYEDCEFFVHNQRTFGNESFHSVCNRYYEKGSVVSFPIFKMKRQFAALDWNEMMRKKALGEADGEIQDWQTVLLERLVAALTA